MNMSKKILQINFKLNVSNVVQFYEEVAAQLAQPIADVKGFRWKVWIVNEADKQAGGIYLFEDDSSVKAFLEGDIVAGVKKNPAVSGIEAKVFDVLDTKHTRITRGPID